MKRRPASFIAYRMTTWALQPFAGLFLRRRLKRGKEDALRFREKLGAPSRARPPGPLAWLHGASVGEGLSLLPLAEKLQLRGLNVLLTTGTATSARLLTERLGPGVLHQFAPLDAPGLVRRFFDHWRPDLGLFAESELWPNILAEAGRRNMPLAQVNARLSPRSFRRWAYLPGLADALLGGFALSLAQTDADAERLAGLGARHAATAGNLKYDAAPPPVDAGKLALLQAEIGARPVWLAASTHAGEEMIAGQAHRRLERAFPNLLTLIAPRHAERGAEIAADLRPLGAPLWRRSQGDSIGPGAGIYLADTMGEMGLLYRLAPVVFVGKSLAAGPRSRLGGQNPIEPAQLGSAILHGPEVGNFEEVFASLDAAEGAAMVADEDELVRALDLLLRDSALLRQMARNAHDAVSRIGGATDRIMQAVEPLIAQIMRERR